MAAISILISLPGASIPEAFIEVPQLGAKLMKKFESAILLC